MLLKLVMVSNISYFHPYLWKISNLTSIFFRWVETTYPAGVGFFSCTASATLSQGSSFLKGLYSDITSGQIIATSHDLTPNGGLVKSRPNTYQRWIVLTEGWGGCCAMEDQLRDLQLEPKLRHLADGELVDMVININLKMPGCLVATTSIHQETIRSDCSVTGKRSVVTLFGVQKQTVGGTTWLVQTDQTTVVEHSIPTLDNLFNVAETCAGIGAVDVGYSEAGASVVITNDNNPKVQPDFACQGS